MIYEWLVALHIVVLGYWLGAELVINSTYRFVCYKDQLPFKARSKLMDQVMNVDQHVRYALILQAMLGTMIAAYIGYFPGGQLLLIIAAITGGSWLIFIELVHRQRSWPVGSLLAKIDRGLRYVLMIILTCIAVGFIGNDWPMPDWLRWKLGCFACVIACGIGIRFTLINHFRTWIVMERDGPGLETNQVIRKTYIQATSILLLLWVFIIAMVIFSIDKRITDMTTIH